MTRTAVRSYTVGIDWASDHHDVCVLEDTGSVVTAFQIPHSAAGLAELDARLRRLAAPGSLRVGIERPSGLLVDTLLDRGYVVIPIHPNALHASRPRYHAARVKSDTDDAYIVADLLRTDGHRFAPLLAPSETTRALRAAVRTRDDLVGTRVQLANQLRSLLESFWPGAAAIFADIDSPIALSFLEHYPSPEHASRLGEARLKRFLVRHHYCGRRSPTALLARLRAAPLGQAGPLECETKGQLVLALVNVLRPLVLQLKDLDSMLAAHLAQHPDGALVQSFPRTGSVNAAQLLAELGEDRRRFSSPAQLAAEAGVAPVTRSSGKHRTVACRFACNKRLRAAVTTWADNSRHGHAWAAAVYARARSRGCDHPHAVRILAAAWLRVLWSCWQHHVSYNPTRHGNAQPFLPKAA
ncbi:MAG TPA: IS110 family transposase [Pirellulaceae bacterium]|nr:IS110 family transposase [Pirellulaceae bacterium]